MQLLQILADENILASFELLNKLKPKFWMRLVIDLASVFVLVRFIYYPIYKNRNYIFTYFIFNLVIFLITHLFNKVELSMGAAFGLFAVFSMLRYRTEGISIKDMTYLFLAIAIGLITAASKGSWDEFIVLNGIILGITYLLESNLLMRNESSKIISYNNMDLIKPDSRKELIADLETKTGMKINRISIKEFDLAKNRVQIEVFYFDKLNKH